MWAARLAKPTRIPQRWFGAFGWLVLQLDLHWEARAGWGRSFCVDEINRRWSAWR